MNVSTRALSLTQILRDENISDSCQLRSSEGKDGIYSNSYKTTGRFASAVTFVARFFSPSTKQSFREANTKLVDLIQNEFGKEAASAFKTAFASRLSWGSPLTAGSVRRFVAACKPTATNPAAIKTTYGEEMASTYQKAFLSHGEVRQGTTSEIRSAFEQLPPQKETITVLSQEISSLSEMGYHTEDEGQFTNAVLPSGGFARVSGESERSALLDGFLYESTQKRADINSFLSTAKRNVQTAESDLSSAYDDMGVVEQAQARLKLRQTQEKLKTLEMATQGYETWPSDRLAAFVGMHKLLESVSDTAVLTEKENLSSLVEGLKSKTPVNLWQDHNTEIGKAEADLKTKEETLQETQGDPFLTEAQRDILKAAVTDAKATLQKLTTKSPLALIAERNVSVQAQEKLISELAPRAKRILEETKGCEKWEPARALAYVHQETAEDQKKSIKFNRLCIKINDAVVPCTDSKSYEENFGLFKAALEKLAGKEIPDHQVSEMIQLVNSERLSQGFASGADLQTGLVLGATQAFPHEMNIFEIKCTKEGAFDFHYDSGRSYLTSLQTPVEPNRFQRVLITLNDQEIPLANCASPAERTKFLKDRIPGALSITDEQVEKVMSQLELLNSTNSAPIESAISALLAETKLTLKIQKKDLVETPTVSSSMAMATGMDSKLETWNRDQAPSDLLQFETKKQFTYRYTPADGKGSFAILDSRQTYLPIPKRGAPFEEKQGDLSPAIQKEFDAAFMASFDSQEVTPDNIRTLNPDLFVTPLLGTINSIAGPLRFDAMGEREGGRAAYPKKTTCTVTPTPQGTYKVSIALLDPDTFVPANGESNVPLKNSFVALDYEVTLGTDNKPHLTGPAHYQYHFEAAHAGVTLLSTGLQRAFGTMLNDPEVRALSVTANIPHEWDSEKGKAVAQDEKLPVISEQFYFDIDRINCSLPSEDGQLTPLYDRSIKEKSEALSQIEGDALCEAERETAAKKFVSFVGDDAKALSISKAVNQQLIFDPLEVAMHTPDGPLQLPGHGGGSPRGNKGEGRTSYAFSKSPDGDVVLRVKVQRNPTSFIPAKIDPQTGKITEEVNPILLNPKNSFVNFDYDLTCHFDDQGELSIIPGPINYNYHLEEGDGVG